MPMPKLTSAMRYLAKEIFESRDPTLLPFLDESPINIPKAIRERIEDVLWREISLDESGEVDARGVMVDDLISHFFSRPLIDEEMKEEQ